MALELGASAEDVKPGTIRGPGGMSQQGSIPLEQLRFGALPSAGATMNSRLGTENIRGPHTRPHPRRPGKGNSPWPCPIRGQCELAPHQRPRADAQEGPRPAALGHIHAGRTFPIGTLTLSYPDSCRVWRRGEEGPRTVRLIEADGCRAQVPSPAACRSGSTTVVHRALASPG
jgi:hypothetical protein